MKERLALLISGGGTTMAEIIKACRSGEIAMDVACVIASSKDAGGIEKARSLGVPLQDIVVVNPEVFKNKDGNIDQVAFGLHLAKELRDRKVTVVTQNGWLPLTPKIVIDAFPGMLFNQHPGPVPAFGGKGMYGRRVHAARLYFTRATKREPFTYAIAQRVHAEFDKGAVVKYLKVGILPSDTVDELQKRVLGAEHQVQIALLKDVAAKRVVEVTPEGGNVLPHEESVLAEAKAEARRQYPNG